jgi:hypothetical protein
VLAFLGAAVLVLLMASAFFRQADLADATDPIRIAAPEDTGGLPIRWMFETEAGESKDVRLEALDELIPTADCCSATAQWAITGGNVDIAVMCPDAASTLLEKDQRYALLGTILCNSDLLVLRPENNSPKVGIMQNRRYQAELLAPRVKDEDIVPLFPAGVVYALENKFLGGGVIDALNAWTLSGDKESLTSGDVATYVLVTSKAFAARPEFKDFVRRFNRSVEDLSTPEGLKNAVLNCKGLQWNQEDVDRWIKLRIKFQKISL